MANTRALAVLGALALVGLMGVLPCAHALATCVNYEYSFAGSVIPFAADPLYDVRTTGINPFGQITYKVTGGTVLRPAVLTNGIYFAVDQYANGCPQLWITDVTSTRPANGAANGECISKPSIGPAFAIVNNYLYFTARPNKTSSALWRYHPSSGSVLVETFGTVSSKGVVVHSPYIGELTPCGTRLFFTAMSPNVGKELFYAVAPATTLKVTEEVHLLDMIGRKVSGVQINETGINADIICATYTAPNSPQLYYRARRAVDADYELWTTNNVTKAGLLGVAVAIQPVKCGLPAVAGGAPVVCNNPTDFLYANKTFYFTAGAENSRKLYALPVNATLATSGGSVQAIVAGAGLLNVRETVSCLGSLFFSGTTATSGAELWWYNATAGISALQLTEINANADGTANALSSSPSDFRCMGSRLWFTCETAATGRELCYLYRNSTSQQFTTVILDIVSGVASSNPQQLWRFDGLTVTKSTATTALLFSAYTADVGREPRFIETGSTDPRKIYNTLDIKLLGDMNPGADGSDPSDWCAVTYKVIPALRPINQVFFSANTELHGRQLILIDLLPFQPYTTVNPTVAVLAGTNPRVEVLASKADINALPNNRLITNSAIEMIEFNGLIWFPAAVGAAGKSGMGTATGTFGVELYYFNKTSGENKTSARLFADLNSGQGSSYPHNFVVVGQQLYFSARTTGNGYELWVTDGKIVDGVPSTAGTFMVRDIAPGAASSYPGEIPTAPSYWEPRLESAAWTGLNRWRTTANANDMVLYFAANFPSGLPGEDFWVGDHPYLWFTLGTNVTTDIVNCPDLTSDEYPIDVQDLHYDEYQLLFSATQQGMFKSPVVVGDGYELYTATSDGCRQLTKIGSGSSGSRPLNFAGVAPGWTLFTAVSNNVGREPYLATYNPANKTTTVEFLFDVFDEGSSDAHQFTVVPSPLTKNPLVTGKAFNRRVYFTARDSATTWALYFTTLTKVNGVYPAPLPIKGGFTAPLTSLKSFNAGGCGTWELIFSSVDADNQLASIWRTDGTTNGTRVLRQFHYDSRDFAQTPEWTSVIKSPLDGNQVAFFAADQVADGWVEALNQVTPGSRLYVTNGATDTPLTYNATGYAALGGGFSPTTTAFIGRDRNPYGLLPVVSSTKLSNVQDALYYISEGELAADGTGSEGNVIKRVSHFRKIGADFFCRDNSTSNITGLTYTNNGVDSYLSVNVPRSFCFNSTTKKVHTSRQLVVRIGNPLSLLGVAIGTELNTPGVPTSLGPMFTIEQTNTGGSRYIATAANGTRVTGIATPLTVRLTFPTAPAGLQQLNLMMRVPINAKNPLGAAKHVFAFNSCPCAQQRLVITATYVEINVCAVGYTFFWAQGPLPAQIPCPTTGSTTGSTTGATTGTTTGTTTGGNHPQLPPGPVCVAYTTTSTHTAIPDWEPSSTSKCVTTSVDSAGFGFYATFTSTEFATQYGLPSNNNFLTVAYKKKYVVAPDNLLLRLYPVPIGLIGETFYDIVIRDTAESLGTTFGQSFVITMEPLPNPSLVLAGSKTPRVVPAIYEIEIRTTGDIDLTNAQLRVAVPYKRRTSITAKATRDVAELPAEDSDAFELDQFADRQTELFDWANADASGFEDVAEDSEDVDLVPQRLAGEEFEVAADPVTGEIDARRKTQIKGLIPKAPAASTKNPAVYWRLVTDLCAPISRAWEKRSSTSIIVRTCIINAQFAWFNQPSLDLVATEDFSTGSGFTPPPGWENTSPDQVEISYFADEAAAAPFNFANQGGLPFVAPIVAPAASFDAFLYAEEANIQTALLRTPWFSTRGLTRISVLTCVYLTFDQWFAPDGKVQAHIDVWNSKVESWVQFAVQTKLSKNPDSEKFDLSTAVVLNDAGVLTAVRFRWTGGNSFFWIIDNVRVYYNACP